GPAATSFLASGAPAIPACGAAATIGDGGEGIFAGWEASRSFAGAAIFPSDRATSRRAFFSACALLNSCVSGGFAAGSTGVGIWAAGEGGSVFAISTAGGLDGDKAGGRDCRMATATT